MPAEGLKARQRLLERSVSRSGSGLRRAHASILLQAGQPMKVAGERLGHANAAFTMSVYQQVLPGMQADAAAAFGKEVFGA